MSYKFEKVEIFDIETILPLFMTFQKFVKLRKDYSFKNCEMCDLPFLINGMVYLAFVKNKQNIFICNDCRDVAISGGAEEKEWKI